MITSAGGVPAVLVFSTQPSSPASANLAFATQPIVEVRDGLGATYPAPTGPEVLLLAYTNSTCTTPVTGGFIADTNPVAAAAGYSAFTNARYDRAGTIYLRASSGTLTSACSSAVVVSGVPSLAWSLASVDFPGETTVGTQSSEINVYLTNSGSAAATGCTAAVVDNSSDFTVTQNCGTTSIPVSSSCHVKIRANPSAPGPRAGILSRTCASGTASVPVTATGTTTYPVLLSSGGNATLALLSDQTAKSWGANWDGRLGLGDVTNRSIPTQIPGASLSGATQISMGESHACARISDGTVKCWGANWNGELGDGTTTQQTSPITVPGLSGVTQVEVGNGFSCALLSDSTVKCWGGNGNGQLGDGTLVSSLSPVQIPSASLTNVVEIALGGGHACARLMDGTVKCWGMNWDGQLGDGTYTQRSVPTQIPALDLSNVVQLSLGGSFSCALLSDTTVKCWGYNWDGQLGNGTTGVSASPVQIPAVDLTGVSQLSAGSSSTCALLSDGSAKCWGANWNGQLGNGTTAYASTPTPVTFVGSNLTQISAGNNFACALLVDNSVRCWGSNWDGELGDGSSGSRLTPTKIDSGILSNVVEVVKGREHSCALKSDGTVMCWGRNMDGQVGDGTNTDRAYPVPVVGLTNVTQIAAGWRHTCALISDQSVKCWGAGWNGQIGDGQWMSTSIPTQIPTLSLSGVTHISSGADHICALLSDQTVKCWGSGGNGQLGDGMWTSQNSPVVVSGLTSVIQVMAAGQLSCAVKSDKTLYCWGANWGGQLGDGSGMSQSTPVAALVTGVTQVVSGGNFTCALLENKTVKCWGDNWEGQLGDGTTVNSMTPVQIPPSALSGVSKLMASGGVGNFGCALLEDQSVKCWGSNNNLQLALSGSPIFNPTLLILPFPIAKLGIGSEGGGFNFGISSSGEVYAWGENMWGALGVPTYSVRRVAGF